MLNGNTKIDPSSTPNDSATLSDDHRHMLVELLAAVGAVGYATFEPGGDRVTLLFAREERKRNERRRSDCCETGMLVPAQLLKIGVNAVVSKLLNGEKDRAGRVELEFVIDATLANDVHTMLLLNVYHGFQVWNERAENFLAWLESTAFNGVWYGDAQASITSTINCRATSAHVTELLVRPT